ncbi:MAG: nuclear transport factor 2 family protein [Acidobacteriota bacterium]|nr:nuclear transport factor 2 family protein [Acidobacteriota bacterium]
MAPKSISIIALAMAILMAAPMLRAGLFRDAHHVWRNELFQMEDNWRNAMLRGNVSALSSMLAEDYMGISANGMLESREQTLAMMRKGTQKFRSIVVNDRKVRFYGSTAVVTSRAEVVGSSPEGDLTGSYRYTHVWVRDGNGPWKIVSFEASRIRGHGVN